MPSEGSARRGHCPGKGRYRPSETDPDPQTSVSPDLRRPASGAVYPGPRRTRRGPFAFPAREGGGDGPRNGGSTVSLATVVVGLQWGDEGKGKAIDLLARPGALVVRYQGGDNAGHTIVLGDEVFKLHLVPSGVLHPDVTPVIAHGVVVNPAVLLAEIAMLESRGVSTAKLRRSAGAHVIMPYHLALDGAMETRLAGDGIGTTRRGIGPAYADRALRVGLRVADLLDPAGLRRQLEIIVPDKN